MFVDEVKVYARAGHGGRGCVAFLREMFRPKGGPSGGNGGHGGDVILEADHDLNNLIHQYYQPRLLAQNGEHGLGKGMDGHAGHDLVVKVPCGTMVWRVPPDLDTPLMEPPVPEDESRPLLPSGTHDRPVLPTSGMTPEAVDPGTEPSVARPLHAQKRDLIADLTAHRQRFVLCRGGRGGLGNRNFATARRQTPRFAQPGEPGEEGSFVLELRLIAEVGLVGYPNAGKSTLLAAISKARPKIAPYPFTTLHPQVGIVEYHDWRRLTVCDVPGLIEGAHRNVGLGHAFLRHIARCKVLVLVLDMAGADGRAPWDDYRQLLRELELYDADLLAKPRLVVANKMDEAVAGKNLQAFKRKVRRVPLVSMAAAFDEGLDHFKAVIRETVEATGLPLAAGSGPEFSQPTP